MSTRGQLAADRGTDLAAASGDERAPHVVHARASVLPIFALDCPVSRACTTMTDSVYSVPLAHRRTENLHIVFWLMKDISWCLMWRALGMFMIVPTLGAAIFITWRARHLRAELAHNLAVVFWITANAWWMIAEFFEFDETVVLLGVSGRHLALIPFGIGAAILARYYVGEWIRRARVGYTPA
jgi:hypothetical protein